MEDRLRETNKWWNKVTKEGEEDAGSVDNHHSLPKVTKLIIVPYKSFVFSDLFFLTIFLHFLCHGCLFDISV